MNDTKDTHYPANSKSEQHAVHILTEDESTQRGLYTGVGVYLRMRIDECRHMVFLNEKQTYAACCYDTSSR